MPTSSEPTSCQEEKIQENSDQEKRLNSISGPGCGIHISVLPLWSFA